MNYFKTFIAYEDSIYSKLKRFIITLDDEISYVFRKPVLLDVSYNFSSSCITCHKPAVLQKLVVQICKKKISVIVYAVNRTLYASVHTYVTLYMCIC